MSCIQNQHLITSNKLESFLLLFKKNKEYSPNVIYDRIELDSDPMWFCYLRTRGTTNAVPHLKITKAQPYYKNDPIQSSIISKYCFSFVHFALELWVSILFLLFTSHRIHLTPCHRFPLCPLPPPSLGLTWIPAPVFVYISHPHHSFLIFPSSSSITQFLSLTPPHPSLPPPAHEADVPSCPC